MGNFAKAFKSSLQNNFLKNLSKQLNVDEGFLQTLDGCVSVCIVISPTTS